MFIWCILSVFGLLIAHRTLSSCETLHLFSSQQITGVRVFCFLVMVSLNFLLRNNLAMLGVFNIVIFLSPWWCAHIIEWQREMLLQEQFVPILDTLILSMKSGKAFRPSLQLCFEKNQPFIRVILQEFISALQYRREIKEVASNHRILSFFEELAQIDQSSHKSIDRLKALRRKISIEKSFRQKSRQALLQIRFQSWIIGSMFLGLLAYVHIQFGLQNHLRLILPTMVLFVVGQIGVLRSGRRYQWKL